MAALLVAACASHAGQVRPSPTDTTSTARPTGYLTKSALPDSAAMLLPPPAPDSVAFALDRMVADQAQALRDTPRWRLAAQDADLRFPQAAGIYACALEAPIDARNTPHLYTLLQRSLIDAAVAGGAAKDRYRRQRPFQANGRGTCTPEDEDKLAHNGSYPSGHSAIGWTWASILAELAPERATALTARARSYGESRLVCNVHWQSDVVAGRSVAAATLAVLHADPAFRADLRAAGEEVARLRKQGAKPDRDCAAEAAALSQTLEDAR
jgi:acid phosphatase (class A)